VRILLAYGLPGLPLAVLTLPVYIYLPTFYAQERGLEVALVGGLLFLARMFDVVIDPIGGHIVDAVPTRFGRRRPWILGSLLLVVPACWFLFVPPPQVGSGYLLGWTLVFYLGWTFLQLPYQAWGAELSPDYNQRARIAATRELFVLAGLLLSLGLPLLLGVGLADALRALALFVLIALPLTALLAVSVVPELPIAGQHSLPIGAGLRLMAQNRPFLRLLLAYLLNGIANGFPATLFFLFARHVLQLPESDAFLLLCVYFAAGLPVMPLWLKLGERWGKHRAWVFAMLWNCPVFIAVMWLGAGDFWPFLIICVLTGVTLGADLALPPAIQADVVDLDTLQSGAQRTGFYFAIWNMATKLAVALAVGIGFPLLELFGFSTKDDNGPTALIALAALYGLFPVLFKLGAVAVAWGHPIDAKRQREIRAAIAAKLSVRNP
jgi:glycoside/pentoside/hexuronide:cation symporter, GPH family